MFWSIWKLLQANPLWLSNRSRDIFNIAKNQSPTNTPNINWFWAFLKRLDMSLGNLNPEFSKEVYDYFENTLIINVKWSLSNNPDFDNYLIQLLINWTNSFIKDNVWNKNYTKSWIDFRSFISSVSNKKETSVYWGDLVKLFYINIKNIYTYNCKTNDDFLWLVKNYIDWSSLTPESYWLYLLWSVYRELLNDNSRQPVEEWLTKIFYGKLWGFNQLNSIYSAMRDSDIRIDEFQKLNHKTKRLAHNRIFNWILNLLDSETKLLKLTDPLESFENIRVLIWQNNYSLISDGVYSLQDFTIFKSLSNDLKVFLLKILIHQLIFSKNTISKYNNTLGDIKFLEQLFKTRKSAIVNIYSLLPIQYKSEFKQFVINVTKKSNLKTSIIKKKFLADIWILI